MLYSLSVPALGHSLGNLDAKCSSQGSCIMLFFLQPMLLLLQCFVFTEHQITTIFIIIATDDNNKTISWAFADNVNSPQAVWLFLSYSLRLT